SGGSAASRSQIRESARTARTCMPLAAVRTTPVTRSPAARARAATRMPVSPQPMISVFMAPALHLGSTGWQAQFQALAIGGARLLFLVQLFEHAAQFEQRFRARLALEAGFEITACATDNVVAQAQPAGRQQQLRFLAVLLEPFL